MTTNPTPTTNLRTQRSKDLDVNQRSAILSQLHKATEAAAPPKLSPESMFSPSAWGRWIRNYLAYVFRKKHDFHSCTASPTLAMYDLLDENDSANKVRVSLAGDWGTGTGEAESVADCIRQFNSHFTISPGMSTTGHRSVNQPPGVQNASNHIQASGHRTRAFTCITHHYWVFRCSSSSTPGFAMQAEQCWVSKQALLSPKPILAHHRYSHWLSHWRTNPFAHSLNRRYTRYRWQLQAKGRIDQLDYGRRHAGSRPTRSHCHLASSCYSAFQNQYKKPAQQIWDAGIRRSVLLVLGTQHPSRLRFIRDG